MRLDIHDQTGKKVGDVEVASKIFEAAVNPALVAQAIRVRLANANTSTASAKTRAEVRGGGRKPWRQKGTGRARQGSIRSPQWKGGGIVHGPLPIKTELSMPQSMRRLALFSSLTSKHQAQQVMVLDGLDLTLPKTKAVQQVLDALKLDRSVLFVLPEKMLDLERSTRNLQHVKTITARVLHPYDVLQHQMIVFLKSSLPTLESTFLGTATTEAKPVTTRRKATAAAVKEQE
jgi:large subunit ribosomal protein L4